MAYFYSVVVGFSTTNKFMSRLIRWVTRGKSSHAWIRYWDESLEQYMVIQAELHGYETIPWARWKTKNRLVSAYVPTSLDLMPGVRHIARLLGVDYDLRSAIWTGLKRWFGKRLKRATSSPKKLMCSEAVCRALQFSGVACVKDLDPETVSPQDLQTALAASDEFSETSDSTWGS